MICVNSYIPTSGESAFESPVFQRYLGHPKRPGHPPMSWISTFRGWEGTPKAKIVFCREFFQKCGGKWWSISLYLRSCRSRKHRTPKIRKVFVHGYPKNGCRCSFPKWLPFFSQKNGLWRVDSFYCNTSHTPKNLNFFHVADIFGTFMNHFYVKEGHRWRYFFWNTSKHWGLWNLMFFDSLRIKDAVWGLRVTPIGAQHETRSPWTICVNNKNPRDSGVLDILFVWSIKFPHSDWNCQSRTDDRWDFLCFLLSKALVASASWWTSNFSSLFDAGTKSDEGFDRIGSCNHGNFSGNPSNVREFCKGQWWFFPHLLMRPILSWEGWHSWGWDVVRLVSSWDGWRFSVWIVPGVNTWCIISRDELSSPVMILLMAKILHQLISSLSH